LPHEVRFVGQVPRERGNYAYDGEVPPGMEPDGTSAISGHFGATRVAPRCLSGVETLFVVVLRCLVCGKVIAAAVRQPRRFLLRFR